MPYQAPSRVAGHTRLISGVHMKRITGASQTTDWSVLSEVNMSTTSHLGNFYFVILDPYKGYSSFTTSESKLGSDYYACVSYQAPYG